MSDKYYRITYWVKEGHHYSSFGQDFSFRERREEAVHGSLADAKKRAKKLALQHLDLNLDGVELYQVKKVGTVEIPGTFTRE